MAKLMNLFFRLPFIGYISMLGLNMDVASSFDVTGTSMAPVLPDDATFAYIMYIDDFSLTRTDEFRYPTATEMNESSSANTVTRKSTSSILIEEVEASSLVTSANSGGDVESFSKWSWYPYRWTWAVIAQLVIAVLGIIGNLLVIIVLYQQREESRSTDTLIGALAVADFMTSVCFIPLPTSRTVPNTWTAHIFCRIIYQPLYIFVWTNLSEGVLTAFSVLRFIAVAHPLYYNRILTKRRIVTIVICLWCLGIVDCIIAIPNVAIIESPDHRFKCKPKYPSNVARIGFASYVVTYHLFLPITIMAITQTLIAIRLQRQSKLFKNTTTTFHLTAKKSVIKMMLIVIIVYVVCWFPLMISVFLNNLGVIRLPAKTPLFQFFVVLGIVNSCANPIIYSARSKEFRESVKGIFVGGAISHGPIFSDKREEYSSKSTSITV